MLTGRRIDAAEAHSVGLVSRVVPAGDLDRETDEMLAALARKPPVAVRLGKAAFLAALETPLVPALEAMQAQLSLLATTEDVKEGVAAFFGKREPRWQGR
jgi:enoyl-CoA hydratase/carnithine racemase